MNALRILIMPIVIAALFPATFPAFASEPVLDRVVLFSRHGVRAPTASPETLATYTPNAWPAWPVKQGELTPRGEALAALMGGYYRGMLAERRLIPAEGCPPADDVRVIADVEERTKATAENLLAGLFPGCGLEPETLPNAKVDPLFHPVEAGICAVDTDIAGNAILGRIGGEFAAILDAYSAPISEMQDVLQCCAPKLCDSEEPCTLATVPSKIDAGKNGVSIKGPLAIASTAGEAFLMEYADGKTPEDVAWGHAATPKALNELLRPHLLALDLTERTPYLAARQGSNPAAQILASLGAGLDENGRGDIVSERLVLLVGHDTNIAALGGLLRLDWVLSTYLPNETPPGGALAFELMRDPDTGDRFVQVAYYSQTLDQLRDARALDLDRPPARAPIAVPGCIATGQAGQACPWSVFVRTVNAAIDPECVAPPR